MEYYFGLKPNQISILPYGLSIDFKINYDDYNKRVKRGTAVSLKKIAISIAGPITNLVIAIIAFFIYSKTKNSHLIDIIYSNLIIALFNLLPIYPMDGGRCLKELLHIFLGLKMSYIIMQKINLLCMAVISALSSVLILKNNNIAILIVIIYLWTIVIKHDKRFELKKQLFY